MPKSFMLLGFAFSAAVAWGNGLTLSELKAQLRARGAGWEAGETSISRLSRAEQKLRLGAQLPEGFGDNFSPRDQKPNHRLPAAFDWRNKDGVNYSSPILNQGSCGSCVAFAAVGVMETQMNITRNTPSSPWAYSPQHLFACGGGACQKGWTPFSALAFMKEDGVPDETCFPYTSGANGDDMACSSSCGDSKARSEKISGYGMPSFLFASVDTVKAALMKGPLVAVMKVYEDFLFYKGGVYKHVSGEMAGGHAVAIVGWNDADKAWIVRNSWGEDFGEQGYFRIGWDDASGVGSQTFSVTVAPKEGYVNLGGLRDRQVLSGKVDISVESTIAGTSTVEYVLKRGESPVAGWEESGRSRSFTVDTTLVKDGVYTLVAKANTTTGMVESQPRTVFVLNGAFTGSVAFNNVTAGQVITGQIDLPIDVAFAPVPFTKITFKARNLATGEEMIRVTPNVLNKMKFLWRAQLAPKGDYELTLTAVAGKHTVVSAPVQVKVQ